MAERIKGLQIDLSMKDMGVSKTLAGIKREFRSLDSSLKLSSNNFKYGEKSAASYKSRMNDLDGAIKSGTTNLNELEKQYNEVSQAQGSNSAKAVRLQTEYNKQANSINAMRDEYGRLNQYYKENFSLSGKLANKFSSIGESMSGVGQKAQDMGSSLTSSITKPALIAGTAMAGITAKLGFDRLVGLDSAKAKLEGLGYSTKEVGSITDQVAKAIQGGMTTMAEGTDVAAGALAAGVKEGKELQKYIKLVGDAAVGSNRPVSEMAMIFNRVQGQGKLMTEELNMVEEGMPGFSNAMAKHLGVSYDAFRKMVTEGEVSSKDFLTVMDDFAGGMAGAYSKSWSGMVQNTKAYIGQIGESLLGGVFEQAKGSLHEFENLLKSPGAQQWAKETGEKIGSAFSKLTSGISSVIKWWQSLDGGTQKTLGGIVKWLGITLVTMGPVLTIFGKFTSMIGGMFSGLSGLIQFFARHNAAAKISTASQALWNGVTATARGIANGYRYAIAALTTSQTAQAIKSKVAAAATVVWTNVTKAATLATRGLGLAIRFMTGPVGIVITVITALVSGIIYLWKTNATFRNIVIKIWNSIKNAAVSSFGFIKGFVVGAFNFVKNNSIKIWQSFKNILLTIIRTWVAGVRNNIMIIRTVTTTVFNFIKSWSIKIWTSLKNGVLSIIRGLTNGTRNLFNILKSGIVKIISTLRNWLITTWTFIKNKIIGIVKSYVNTVRNNFNFLKNGIVKIISNLRSWLITAWNFIKNKTVSIVRSLWSGMKNIFNSLSKGTRSIFNSVKNFLIDLWLKIKNKVVNFAKNLLNGVVGKWRSLLSSTKNIIGSVSSFLFDKWRGIKDKTVGFATTIKDKVTGAFGVMRDSLKKIIGKITGFFDDMMGGVEKGLNSLIKGINKVGSMLGMGKEMIKPVKLSTGTEGASGNVVSNGAISSPTLATVNDSGPGNARGIGGYQELIQKSNGSVFAPQGKDATVMLDKGDRVINGRTTAKLQKTGQIPKFSKGTGKNKKKDKNLLEQGWDAVNGKYESAKHGISKGMQKTGEALTSAGKFSKDWITKNIGDVMDWIKKPGKLLNKILDGMGVGMSSFGIKKGNVPYDLMSGMFKKLKSAATDLIKSWFEEAEGGEGDAGWLLKHDIWQKFGNYTGGLGFNGGKHYGVDFGMTPGTNVKAVASGRVSRVWNDYGGGKSIEIAIGKGLTNQYMHLSKQLVKKGQKVGVGDLIAKSGNTGNFTAGSGHLHFQLNKNGVPQSNVLEWLKGLGGGGKKKPSAWGSTIDKAAKKMKVNLSSAERKGIIAQIARESNGDAGVTQGNIGDINNLRGTPAQGLLQYVPSTFKSYAMKGHTNIKSGYDQLLAFFNNKNWRRDLPYGKSGWGPSGGRRFATGGLINSSGFYQLAEEGHPEFVIPTDPSRQSDAMKLLAIARQRIEGNKKNKRPNQMRTPSNGNNNDNEMINYMARQLEATQKQVELLTQLVASNQRLEQKPTGVSESDMSRAQGKRAQMMAYNMGGAF